MDHKQTDHKQTQKQKSRHTCKQKQKENCLKTEIISQQTEYSVHCVIIKLINGIGIDFGIFLIIGIDIGIGTGFTA